MTWSSSCDEDDCEEDLDRRFKETSMPLAAKICPSCGQKIQVDNQASSGIQDLPGLPAGVKFDPTDQELLEHLEGKVRPDLQKLHPLIDEFIPTIEGDNGICYTHPDKLPDSRSPMELAASKSRRWSSVSWIPFLAIMLLAFMASKLGQKQRETMNAEKRQVEGSWIQRMNLNRLDPSPDLSLKLLLARVC